MRYRRGDCYIPLARKPAWWHRAGMRLFGWRLC